MSQLSRLGSPTAFNPDSGQTTGLGVKKKKKRLGVEPVESAQPANLRPRFNQLRQSQLERQGVNVKELKQTNDTNRQRIRDSEASRVDAGQEVRRLRASGNIEGANALRASLREQRAGETELRREVADRSSLLRGSIADLPPQQQLAERQRGRDHLNAQLPGIAAAAATAASTAEDAQLNRLADIGARIFEIQSPGRSADGLNRFELARLAEGADPDVIDRATRGVGLPSDRTAGLRDFADRTQGLAQTGIDFGENTVRQRRLDPELIEQINAEQETQSIRDAAIGQIERDQIAQQTLASTNETGRLNRDAAVLNQERTLADLGAAGNIASQEIVPDRGRLERAQIEQAIKALGGEAPGAAFGESVSQFDPVAAMNVVSGSSAAALKGISNAKNHAEAAPLADEFASTVASIFADPNTSPEQKRVVASEMLKQIEESGIDPDRVAAPLRSTGTLTRLANLNPLNPSPVPLVNKADMDALDAVNTTVKRAIRTLREMAGQSAGA